MAAITASHVRIIIGILVLIILYTVSYSYHSNATSGFGTHKLVPSFLHGKSSRETFVERALARDVSDPFDIMSITRLCRNRPSRDDVIVSCNPGNGGVGNIRSHILHCTRYALEAGASMILPTFYRRSNTDLADLFGQISNFQYLFDRQHFVDTIHSACPHISVYDYPNSEWTMSNMGIPHWPVAINESSIYEPSPWRREFDTWVEENIAGMKTPVVVTSSDLGLDRAVMDDGIELYYNFGRLLQFRPDARRLAAACMAEMSSRFGLHMKADSNIFEKAYMGAHLRTSSDAVKAGWKPDFEGQTDWYIDQTLKHGLKIIYAAGGNEIDLERFAEKASKHGIILVQKSDLLSDNDLRELDNLVWDQRGLVDFEVLLRASQFGGYGRSSFSLNIAARRHFVSGVEDPHSDPENVFVDEHSVVYGRFDAGWEAECRRTMWP